MDRPLARKAHNTLEPFHVVVYFAAEAGGIYTSAGLKGGMRHYFASRSAALGQVPAEVVIATFYNFKPELVREAIPSSWQDVTPETMLAARLEVADVALRRILTDEVVESSDMAEAATLARTACDAITGDVAGRPLYAAHASLPWPQAPHLALWHAQTLLREYRGDGHVAALLTAGLDPCEALVAYLPMGQGLPEAVLKGTRGWSDDEWNAAATRLQDRGLLTADRNFTEAGQAQRDQIEAQTDELARAPFDHLGEEKVERLRELVRPWTRAISNSMFG